jgi:alginate O-acetyltransferase complex protein AlgF
VAIGQQSQAVDAAAGAFVSVVLGAPGKSEGVAMVDTVSANRAKATLLLYNLSSQGGVDLATADGKVTVFTDVEPGTEAMREVNGLTVAFTVHGPSAPVTTLPTVTLERGLAYSVFVYESGGKLAATWLANSTGAVK